MNWESSAESESIMSPPAPARRHDSLPFWVVALLIFFAVMRLCDLVKPPDVIKNPLHQATSSKAAAPGLNVEAMRDLIETDMSAKIAFAEAAAEPGSVSQPSRTQLADALKGAERLQRESGNTPGTARRVLILRALLRHLPATKKSSPVADPLAAFSAPPSDSLSDVDKARYAAEARLWRDALDAKRGAGDPAAQSLAAKIRALPNIRWWRYPGLVVLYQARGNAVLATALAKEAANRTVGPLFGVVVLQAILLGLLLIGTGILVYFFVLFVRNRQAAVAGRQFDTNLWLTESAPIADVDRRLGAGDLMGIFVLYLVTREVLGFLLTGFHGFGHAHLAHFGGLLTSHMKEIDKMSITDRNKLSVLLESLAYIVTALPPIAALLVLARRRGASLADEIGWNRRKLGLNALYALGGIAIAQPIMMLAAVIAPRIFKHAPDPSNPAIPQLVYASGLLIPMLLVLLASVAAPLVEELFFRGLFYQAARLRLGVWPAIFLTGAVFGFVHPVGVEQMFALAILGSVFAWMAETRKSLLPGILAHGFNNLTTTLLLLWVMAG